MHESVGRALARGVLMAGAVGLILTGCSKESAKEPTGADGASQAQAALEQAAMPKPPEPGAPPVADPSASYMDADSTLQEMVKAGGHVMPEKGKVSADPTPESKAVPEFDAGFHKVMMDYHVIRKALAADGVVGVKEAATRIQETMSLLKGVPSPAVTPEEQTKLTGVLDAVGSAAGTLGAAPDIKASRDALALLTKPMMYVVAFHYHPAAGQEPRTYWCPMKNLAWFQDVPEMGNPYYGTEMLVCGFKVAKGGS